MDRIIDEIVLFSLCLILALASSFGTFGIVGVLAIVIVVCACELISSALLRAACLIAFLCCTLFFSSFWALLPLATYECVAQRSNIMRFIWIPFVCAVCLFSTGETSIGIMLLSIAAALIAMRTAQKAAESRAMRRMRDGLREQLNDAELEATKMKDRISLDNEVLDASQEGTALGKTRQPILDGLTDREQVIASFIAEGLDNKEIASEIYLSEGTVRNHISSILQKCHLKNRTQIAIMYLTELYS